MDEKFDNKKYNIEYRKKHKAIFSVDLNIQEKQELMELLKKHNLTQVKFVRDAIETLKNKEFE